MSRIAFWGAKTTRLDSKVKSETRDMEAASGDVSYTGYGFQPTALISFGVLNTVAGMSWGVADSALAEQSIYIYAVNDYRAGVNVFQKVCETGTKYQSSVVKTLDADGYTLTWTLVGATGAGTAYLAILALR